MANETTPRPILQAVPRTPEDDLAARKVQGFIDLFTAIRHRPPRVDWSK